MKLEIKARDAANRVQTTRVCRHDSTFLSERLFRKCSSASFTPAPNERDAAPTVVGRYPGRYQIIPELITYLASMETGVVLLRLFGTESGEAKNVHYLST